MQTVLLFFVAYPWTRILDPNLNHWLYLTDVTYPPDPKLLIGTVKLLIWVTVFSNRQPVLTQFSLQDLMFWLSGTNISLDIPLLFTGDFLQLLFACCQENVFSLERYSWSSEEPTQPSDNTRRSSRNKIITPDFMWNITWLDFTKVRKLIERLVCVVSDVISLALKRQ
jgi:hypothetical protein